MSTVTIRDAKLSDAERLLEIYNASRKAKTIISRLSDLSRKNTAVTFRPVALDELVKKTGFPATKVLQTLVLLQLGGHIREIRKNEYVRTDSRIIDGEVFSNRGVTGKGEDN